MSLTRPVTMIGIDDPVREYLKAAEAEIIAARQTRAKRALLNEIQDMLRSDVRLELARLVSRMVARVLVRCFRMGVADPVTVHVGPGDDHDWGSDPDALARLARLSNLAQRIAKHDPKTSRALTLILERALDRLDAADADRRYRLIATIARVQGTPRMPNVMWPAVGWVYE